MVFGEVMVLYNISLSSNILIKILLHLLKLFIPYLSFLLVFLIKEKVI
jgi:hypothetical protein